MVSDEELYGVENAKKLKDFKNELLKIEQKHLNFFNNRKSRIDNTQKDELSNYYSIITQSTGINFIIIDQTLPNDIQEECLKTFKHYFK